ncbi:MAG: DUF4272 domain-containing protein [Flavobacteriaceae bacterium]|nr:DUF4272 domain-containing protein [Flavobacteriaceae bacterium]
MKLRSETLPRVDQAGFPHPPIHFPVLWEAGDVPSVRSGEEIVQRVAVLNVIVNCAYGMPSDAASAWLADNRLEHCVTERERLVLAGELGRVEEDKTQVEAIHALVWTLGIVATLDAARFCGDDLAQQLPDLRSSEPISAWLRRRPIQSRPTDEVLTQWDLYFCLTWGLADANLRRATVPGPLPQYVYWHRRRALEFACGSHLGHSDWDSIDLST